MYADLLEALFEKLRLGEYQAVKINVDSRKVRGGILAKRAFRVGFERFLHDAYPQTRITYAIASSTTDILLEFADFISNMFYRAYQQDDDRFFQELKFKLIQIKNPL